MIRYLGIALVFVSVTSLATVLDRRRSRRLAEEAALLRLLAALRREIGCYARPLSAFAADFTDDTLDAVGFTDALRKTGSLSEALAAVRPTLAVTEDFYRPLASYAASFGRGYREEELRALEATAAQVGAVYTKEEADAPRHRRLCHTLCLSLSLAIVILLL